jgi:hypothetical protein
MFLPYKSSLSLYLSLSLQLGENDRTKLILSLRRDASESFKTAIRILNDCESQDVAVLRSKFALSKAFNEIGAFDEAKHLMQDITKALAALDNSINESDLTEDYFEQFVLYCHR